MHMDVLSSSARVIWVRGCETGERRGCVGRYCLFQLSREHEGRRVSMLKEGRLMSSLLKAMGHHLFTFRRPSTTLSHGQCVLTRSKPPSLLASSLYSLLLTSQSKRVSRSDQCVSRAIRRNERGLISKMGQCDAIFIPLTEHVFVARLVLLRRIGLLQGNCWSWDASAARVGSKSRSNPCRYVPAPHPHLSEHSTGGTAQQNVSSGWMVPV